MFQDLDECVWEGVWGRCVRAWTTVVLGHGEGGRLWLWGRAKIVVC